MTYSIGAYGRMIGDPVRTDAYTRALTESVREGDVVLELGTGFGYFAVIACRLGAAKVYAIEPDDSIELARHVARINGCAERIQFIKAMSTDITLPGPADVLISDLRGVLPLHQLHIPALVDARNRLVKPGGVIIPLRDELRAVIVESQLTYRKVVEPWLGCDPTVNLAPVRDITTNTWEKRRFTRADFLAQPQSVCTLDYAVIESPDIDSDIEWVCNRDGTAHGLDVWFDATLIPGVQFSNSPDSAEAIYGSSFFPFQSPVEVKAGDNVAVHFSADLVGSRYVWRWDTKVSRDGRCFAQFRQSTMKSTPMPLDKLRRHRDDYVPQRSESVEIAEFIFHRLNGVMSLGVIARELAESHPARFRDWHVALAHVADVVEKLPQDRAGHPLVG